MTEVLSDGDRRPVDFTGNNRCLQSTERRQQRLLRRGVWLQVPCYCPPDVQLPRQPRQRPASRYSGIYVSILSPSKTCNLHARANCIISRVLIILTVTVHNFY